MSGRRIKAMCLGIVVCLIGLMFFVVTIINGSVADVANPVSAIVLLALVAAAIVPVYVAHEKQS